MYRKRTRRGGALVLSGMLALAVVLMPGAAASAQGPTEVPVGSGFTLENGTECAPNSDVAVYFGAPEAEDARRIGVAISDGTGHFSVNVALPEGTALGAGVLTVECGMESSVLLYDITVTEAESEVLLDYAPAAAAVVGVLVVCGLIVARVRRPSADETTTVAAIANEQETKAPKPKKDKVAKDKAEKTDKQEKREKREKKAANRRNKGNKMRRSRDVKADATPDFEESETNGHPRASDQNSPSVLSTELPVPDDSDDDPDYWIWDVETERGPAKRVACLTDQHFYLHEVSAQSFNALLEKLTAMGPDAALKSAFFKVAVRDIDEIQHHKTEIRIKYRADDGFVAKTIDLATELDEVIGFLSRRVPVVAAQPAIPSA